MNPDSAIGRFDEIASLYDAMRPGYPPETIEAIEGEAALERRARILEIGCGTGQITVPFAARGYRIVALEPGARLAAVARRRCGPYPHVEIHESTFEQWRDSEASFDLIVSAQAFHWIDAQHGYEKAARLLRPGGTIALVWHLDASHDSRFAAATRAAYRQYFPNQPAELRDPLNDKVEAARMHLESSPSFGRVRLRRHEWQIRYSVDHYLGLLQTFSSVRALAPRDRDDFIRAVKTVADRLGGVIDQQWETVALLASRL